MCHALGEEDVAVHREGLLGGAEGGYRRARGGGAGEVGAEEIDHSLVLVFQYKYYGVSV